MTVRTTSNPVVTAREILAVLRTVLDLPDCITALDLSLHLDDVPVVTCRFNPTSTHVG